METQVRFLGTVLLFFIFFGTAQAGHLTSPHMWLEVDDPFVRYFYFVLAIREYLSMYNDCVVIS